jgi:hypothetical protein
LLLAKLVCNTASEACLLLLAKLVCSSVACAVAVVLHVLLLLLCRTWDASLASAITSRT